jgi:hypothetical protein
MRLPIQEVLREARIAHIVVVLILVIKVVHIQAIGVAHIALNQKAIQANLSLIQHQRNHLLI